MTESKLIYRKSSFSNDRGPNVRCVEVAIASDKVFVRHSARPEPTIEFSSEEWQTFVAGVKSNEFNIPGV